MNHLPRPLKDAIEEFNHLPGIGHKTSERFVFFLLKQPKMVLERFASRLLTLRDQIFLCAQCYTYTEKNPCHICSDSRREHGIICVVSESADILALEKAGVFSGVYHVLGGVINQLEGIGPQHLRIPELLKRAQSDTIKEIILALNPDIEGDSSALYLAQVLKGLDVKVTRLARGLPTGSNIEYADELTLANALDGRKDVKR